MTQMFTIEARPYFIFRGPPSQACFQTCIRTQPCPVQCQILATIILKLLGEIYFGHFQLLFLYDLCLGETLDPCYASLGEYAPSDFWGLMLAVAQLHCHVMVLY